MARKRPEPEPEGPLLPFEGHDVTQSRIEIPGAAGGLQDSMAFDPVEIHHGDTVYIAMRCECVKVRFEPLKGEDEKAQLRRVQILAPVDKYGNKGAGAMLVSADLIEPMLDEHAEAMRLRKEESKGIMRLAIVEADPDADDESDEVGADAFRSTGDEFYDPGEAGYPPDEA